MRAIEVTREACIRVDWFDGYGDNDHLFWMDEAHGLGVLIRDLVERGIIPVVSVFEDDRFHVAEGE